MFHERLNETSESVKKNVHTIWLLVIMPFVMLFVLLQPKPSKKINQQQYLLNEIDGLLG